MKNHISNIIILAAFILYGLAFDSCAVENKAPVISVGGSAIISESIYNANAVAILPGGAFVIAGYKNGDFGLAKYSKYGALVPDFGNGGVVYTDLAGFKDEANSLALYPNETIIVNDKILAAGVGSLGNSERFALTRYLASGALDNSFGNQGKVLTLVGDSQDVIHKVTIQQDEKILAVGSTSTTGRMVALVRYNQDGSLDASFGDGGKVLWRGGEAYGLALHEGRIIVSGCFENPSHYEGYSFGIVRFTSEGAVDSTFGNNGVVFTGFSNELRGCAYNLLVQSDGKILAVGAYSLNTDDNIALVRYNQNGSLDITFGNGGRVTNNIGYYTKDTGKIIKIKPDGKLLLAGESNSNIVITQYTSNGEIDPDFGVDGTVLHDTYGLWGYLWSINDMAIFNDGKMLLSIYTGQGKSIILRLNEDGSLDNLTTPVFTENGPAVTINTRITAFDTELSYGGNYSGASLIIRRHGGAHSDDMFSATGGLSNLIQAGPLILSGITIGTVTQNSMGILSLVFNGNATQARINEAMQAIAYRNASENPPTSVTLLWSLNDGNTGSQGTGGAMTGTAQSIVAIIPLNDLPSGNSSTISVPYGESYSFTNASFGFSDPEDGSLLKAVRIDTLPDSGYLTFNQSAFSPGAEFSATDSQIGLHLLVFHAPASSVADSTNFSFSVKDSSGGYDPTPNTITINYQSSLNTLTVGRIGTGSGTIIGAGINCGSDCTESYVPGTVVTLTALPTVGSTFTGWTGECTPNGMTCQATVNAALYVLASFTAISNKTFPISVTTEGVGTVTSTPAGIDCGQICHKDFPEQSIVTLTATPPGGAAFTGWNGACSGTSSTCQLISNVAQNAIATFSPNPASTYILTVQLSGNGSVTSSPTGIVCGSDCSGTYARGAVVTLTANPADGSRFAGWSGICSGMALTCQITMSAARTVKATFTTAPASLKYSLELTRIWPTMTGGGVEILPPYVIYDPHPGILTCTDATEQRCFASYPVDTVVTLKAIPTDSTRFVGWDGRCAGWQDTCQITLNKNKDAVASFAEEETPDANKPVLRDAIYMYQMSLWGQSEKRITGHHCDILELVLDVTSGYTDMALVPSVTLGMATNYVDRIFATDAMFTYTLYADATEKRFILRDNQNPSSDNKIGQGTFFGYCYSTQGDAYVEVYDQKTNTTYFSDGTTQ